MADSVNLCACMRFATINAPAKAEFVSLGTTTRSGFCFCGILSRPNIIFAVCGAEVLLLTFARAHCHLTIIMLTSMNYVKMDLLVFACQVNERTGLSDLRSST